MSPGLDSAERAIPLIFKILVYLLLCVFFVQAVEMFSAYTPGQQWPFLLGMLRTWTFLPIHEAGHLLFKFFGRTLNILGGSFWQVMFPFLWFLIALKQRSHVAPFALFWTGENMMDVSLYVRDAPLRWLPLLGGHASRHDWYNLLQDWNALDSAETVADVFFIGGAVTCILSVGSGVVLALRSFYKPALGSKEIDLA